jgi:hypothetical protein
MSSAVSQACVVPATHTAGAATSATHVEQAATTDVGTTAASESSSV